MTRTFRRFGARLAAAAFLAVAAAAAAQSPAEMATLVSDQLVYPREARYTIPAVLPSDAGDVARNAQWIAVAEKLAQAGLLRLNRSGGRTMLETTEKSIGAVVPSMNLRYETTAIHVVLGRWEIEVSKVSGAAGATLAEGRRRLVKRTKAYPLVMESLPAADAAAYADRDAVWQVTGRGATAEVAERLR